MEKAVLIGDYEKADYHPLTKIDEELKSIFKNIFDITCTENYNILKKESLKDFKLCILYADRWNEVVSNELMDDLIELVRQGMGLLVIHNGISFQSNQKFLSLIGGKFTGHPAFTTMKIMITEPAHIILDKIPEFSIEDEPYRYEFNDSIEKQIILEYIHEGKTYPAAWVRNEGSGRIVYLMPGHNVQSIKNAVYRDVILRSGCWASKLDFH